MVQETKRSTLGGQVHSDENKLANGSKQPIDKVIYIEGGAQTLQMHVLHVCCLPQLHNFPLELLNNVDLLVQALRQ